jgi:DNA-binding CsgD family transcriptional regulator
MTPFPNLSEIQLGDAIRRIGQPGFEAALWQLLRTATGADNLVALAYRDAGPPISLYRQTDSPNVFAAFEATYLAGAYRLDPYFDLHLSRVPSGAYRLRDVAPDAFQRSRYFIEYYEQTTLIDEVTFICYPAAAVSINLCLGRDATSGMAFSPREVEVCQRLAPIVNAMAERHWSTLSSADGPADDSAALLAKAAQIRHDIRLSQRQAEVALLILQGHSSTSVGLRLGVSPQTVKVFRKQLYQRCGISSQAELFALMLPLLRGTG